MLPSVGFILITHNKPEQTFRLVNLLNQLFCHPPIVIHNDFSQSFLEAKKLTSNAEVCFPYYKTAWGDFSVIDAAIACLKKLYSGLNPPDWFYLISNSCYPIKPRSSMLEQLEKSDFDVHISNEHIDWRNHRTDWQKICFNRYFKYTPSIALLVKNRKFRKIMEINAPYLTKQIIPFSKSFLCYAGEQWFTANRKAANILIDFHENKSALAKHYRHEGLFRKIVPDESYYHSVFCNSGILKISNNNYRYIDWSLGGSHPKIFTINDFELIKESDAHFARKFDSSNDSKILDLIENNLL